VPELTRTALANGNSARWRDWLRNGIVSWCRYPGPADRARAFLPLVIDPFSHYPAAELSRQIDDLLKGKAAHVGRAAADVLKSWSVTQDTGAGAAMAIEIATRFNAPRLGQLCRLIVEKTPPDSEEEADRLAWAAIAALEVRGTRSDVESLGHAISRNYLWNSSLMAEYSVLLGRANLRALPVRLVDVAPIVIAAPYDGRWTTAIAERLLIEFSRDDLLEAFCREPGDDPETYRFRQRLYDLVVPAQPRFGESVLKGRQKHVLKLIETGHSGGGEEAEGIDERFEEPPGEDEEFRMGGSRP
jgi:hypothetical protein